MNVAFQPRAPLGERLVYGRSTRGHRRSYLDILGARFGLEAVTGKIDHRVFRRLVVAESLLFATLDDHFPSFVAVAGARTALGRHTVALFLRAQKCFEGTRWYFPLKRGTCRVLKNLPGLTIASITPFSVMPRHREVAHAGVVDPQYWDMHDGMILRSPAGSSLSDQVLARAGGRHVMCIMGTLGLNKGVTFLAETLRRYPELAQKTLVVAAGHVPADAIRSVSAMANAGAFVIDRFVANDELESLYAAADSVWACYAPDYDQASGIFGRAVQFGVAPVLRKGSITEAFSLANGVEHIAVSYGNHDALAALLAGVGKRPGKECDPERSRMIGEWRRQFIETVGTALLPVLHASDRL